MLWRVLGSGLRPPAAEVRTIDAAYSSHRHSTDREQVRIQSETSGSPCGLCVMQFDVPNLHNSYLKFSIQAAVRLVPPLPAGYRYLGRYVCGLCVLRGYGTTTRHANRARVRRRERHDRTTHDRLHELQHNSYHAGAQACLCVTGLRVSAGGRGTRARRGCATDKAEPRCVCCSRGLGLLTSPVGVESQRPETTMAFHKKRFRVRDHLRDITRHHVIVVTRVPSLSSSAQVGHPLAALRWLGFRVQHCRCARR